MQRTKTHTPKQDEIVQKWHVIDAENQILGRLAVKVTNILMGKNKAQFTPNLKVNDKVIITNVEKVRVTGKKQTGKIYQWHTMYPKGLRSITYANAFEKDPVKTFVRAVKGMLPKNKLQKFRITDLYVYKGAEHPHKAQVK
jgi:large subunit ribosomal protein L13